MFWRFEHQYFIQGGVKFDTWDPKLNRDLEPLEQSSIDTGGFRIDAFFLKGTKYENAHQVIRFVKEDESYNSKTFTGGVTTYKGYIIVGRKSAKLTQKPLLWSAQGKIKTPFARGSETSYTVRLTTSVIGLLHPRHRRKG